MPRPARKSPQTPMLGDTPAPPTPQTTTARTPVAGTPTAVAYSCVACKQRKVRCSRQFPCAECVRMDVECVPSSRKPYASRKRRRGQDEAESSEQPRPHNHLVSRTVDTPREQMGPERRQTDATTERPTLLAFGQHLWTGLPEDFREPQSVETPASDGRSAPPVGSGATPLTDASTLLFGQSVAGFSNASLRNAHPQPVHAFSLWQTYLHSINPLSKVIYAPQVQDLVIQAAGSYDSLSTVNIALLFSIYAAAVSAMSEADCEAKLGEAKQTLLERYLSCAQKALAAAGFMRYTNLALVQAFTIFLLAARQSYDASSMWLLTGMALRMGQRLLATVPAKSTKTSDVNGNRHSIRPRDRNKSGKPEAPSFFETQMRLRVWWQILLIDGRVAQLSGQSRIVYSALPDYPLPANLSDSDINPDMVSPPPPIEDRPTEMVFCLLRYEMGKFMFAKGSLLNDPTSKMADRDAAIDDIAAYFKEKFLDHLDPAIPLHHIAEAGAHAAVDKMRLMAHHPGQYPDKGKSMPQAEHDMLFKTSIDMVDILVQGFDARYLEHFKWHIDVYFQLDAVVFMLIESQSQPPESELVNRAWELVASVLHFKRDLVQEDDELGRAVRQLVFRAWESRERRARKQNPGAALPTPPASVAQLFSEMRQRRRAAQTQTNGEGPCAKDNISGPDGDGESAQQVSPGSTAVESAAVVSTMHETLSELAPLPDLQYSGPGSSSLDTSPFSSYNDVDLLGWETIDWDSWGYWNQLLQGQA
ncbi:hypothetical protein HMPREF1624_02047 [Sporothrix schenckii ATCC 58251]|uniref:Zn(2)-C6 fungal-type domain-containing protein n=1 Tax=Sporothrix schenckii (strain ATCC 58251 / de Perez 2211183) TaxID=1391915 RepID=U7PYT0_SPOS1|nr:hypothetical protein HMPREF1624_02047 [Sporothrix schenckii ATCC 58251]